MFAIRLKSNPLKLKAFGYTTKRGDLGEYDPDLFEEVELEQLPEGWEQYKELPTLTRFDLYQELIKVISDNWPTNGKSTDTIITELTTIFDALNKYRIFCESRGNITAAELDILKQRFASTLQPIPFVNADVLTAINNLLNQALTKYKSIS